MKINWVEIGIVVVLLTIGFIGGAVSEHIYLVNECKTTGIFLAVPSGEAYFCVNSNMVSRDIKF